MRHINTKTAREFANSADRYTGAEVRVWVHDLCDNLDALRAENVHLRREQEIARGMLHDLMRNTSTPPSGLYVPDDVRAALAQEDSDHG